MNIQTIILVLSCVMSAQLMSGTFSLMSPAFSNNKFIPNTYACDGANISPSLSWTNIPLNTKSFALIVDDPDAEEKVWVHWLIFNIPATVTSLPEGANTNFISGVTDFYYMRHGVWQYVGPCPPKGVHHYHFTLYALDIMLNLSEQATKEDVIKAMQGHVLGQAEVIGLYQRQT